MLHNHAAEMAATLTRDQERALIRTKVLAALVRRGGRPHEPAFVDAIVSYCGVRYMRRKNWNTSTGDQFDVTVPVVCVLHADGAECMNRPYEPCGIDQLIDEVIRDGAPDYGWRRHHWPATDPQRTRGE